MEQAKEKRFELLTKLADYNDEIGMGLLEDENYNPPSMYIKLKYNIERLILILL